MILKQSTAATVVVGPVLDSAGAAVTTAVTANFSLSKNGTVNALTSETVTHSTNGYYTIALTSSNTDTLGRIEIIVNDSAMSMATHRYNVIVGTSYDLLVTSGGYSTLDASGIRTAVGLASANLDTQLSTIDTVVDNIETDTQDIQSRIPAALVSGRIDAHVGAMGNDTITNAALTTAAADEIAERAANLDILTTPFSANTWARVLRDTYLNVTIVDVIVDQILADTNDIQTRLPAALVSGRIDASVGAMAANTLTASALASDATAEIADAVYDEPYAGHTTPGTYGFLWDKWRKSNPAITGEVTAAVTPTTTTFSTDITGYADTAFDNAVLVFINGSTNADFRGVVSGYLQANGQVTITPALPQAPVVGDEFTIAIPSFVYTLAQVQSGLATSAELAVVDAIADKLDTTLELDGAVYRFTTNALEQAPGGGSSSITITAGAANAPARSDDTNLIAFVDETISQALAIYEADGTTAKDMSGKTLTVVFENLETADTAVVPSGSITVSGADNNTVTWAYPSAVTTTVGTYRYALRDEAAPKTVYAQGLLFVKVAAAVD